MIDSGRRARIRGRDPSPGFATGSGAAGACRRKRLAEPRVHAIPSFPTGSKLWLKFIEAYGL
jgi:hypothetical protein